MVQQQWRIRISGQPREQLDTALLVQAVLALGEQLHREAQERAEAENSEQAASGSNFSVSNVPRTHVPGPDSARSPRATDDLPDQA